MDENSRQAGAAKEQAARQEAEILEGDIYALEFGLATSVCYHAKRRRFFTNLQYSANILNLVGGSSAFFAIAGGLPGISMIGAAFVALISFCNLVINFSEKARLYEGLCRKFGLLNAKVAEGERTRENYRKWKAERLTLEAEEPPALSLLADICNNEVAIGLGHYDYVVKNIDWRRCLANIFSFDSYHHKLMSTHRQ